MILPTTEQILSNLPVALTWWTAITLSWGVYMLFAYNTMMKYADQHEGGRREVDVHNAQFIKGVIIILALSLALGPMIVNFSDVLIVANVFINLVFVIQTITLSRWWNRKNTPDVPLTPHHD